MRSDCKFLSSAAIAKQEMNCFHIIVVVTIYIYGEIIINSANMYLINLLPKRFRLAASSEV